MYDGWNLIRKISQKPGVPSRPRHFVHGLDINSSLKSAGAIGTILAATDGSRTLLYCYDAPGNARQLIDSPGDTVSAIYKYDPFGRQTHIQGPAAEANLFRYSSKYYDHETGLLYYGYRYYAPIIGRWTSRDPAEEDGSLNLYAFVNNDAINKYDLLGRWGIWFWMDASHGKMTEEAYTAAIANITNYLSDEENDAVSETLVLESISQDINHLSEHHRHYSLSNDNPSYNDRVATWIRYSKYLSDELVNFENKLLKTDLNGKDCAKALEALGLVSHSWQDYYGHGISIKHGWNTSTIDLGIPGSKNLLPCSWSPNPIAQTEHPSSILGEPIVKPENSEPDLTDYTRRRYYSVDFTREKYQEYLPSWIKKCKCYARKIKCYRDALF